MLYDDRFAVAGDNSVTVARDDGDILFWLSGYSGGTVGIGRWLHSTAKFCGTQKV